jgi:sulfonate dioxygenase
VCTHSLNQESHPPFDRPSTHTLRPPSPLSHISSAWNPGFTRRIADVPKAESDAILSFLFSQISENHDFQVRFKWQPNDVAIWDNRVRKATFSLLPLHPLTITSPRFIPCIKVVTHSAIFDFWPATRHALRATPHGERPISVADYERTTGKRARDRQLDLWERQGVVLPEQKKDLPQGRGYND